MKRQILFVDDNENVLHGIRRMLRPMRQEWDVDFATSGEEALAMMNEKPFDVIVSDMRMPGMDGASLLTEVMKRHPNTIRFVLSGQSDKETILRSIGPTHQFLAKPCDSETLKNAVEQALALRNLMSSVRLKQLVSQLVTLPSLPILYQKIMSELRSDDPSVKTIGKIIERDVGMSAKILQLVNSAFFGVRQNISSPQQAVTILGLDVLRSLVLMVGIFRQLEDKDLPLSFDVDTFWNHSILTGQAARLIAEQIRPDKEIVEDSFTAGLLHDIGKLVLAINYPEDYEKCLSLAKETHSLLWEAEVEIFGASHAEVGAYLLGVWGLNDSIVHAVALHHTPNFAPDKTPSPLTFVHIANALCAHDLETAQEKQFLDTAYCDTLEISARLPEWEKLFVSLKEKFSS